MLSCLSTTLTIHSPPSPRRWSLLSCAERSWVRTCMNTRHEFEYKCGRHKNYIYACRAKRFLCFRITGASPNAQKQAVRGSKTGWGFGWWDRGGSVWLAKGSILDTLEIFVFWLLAFVCSACCLLKLVQGSSTPIPFLQESFPCLASKASSLFFPS